MAAGAEWGCPGTKGSSRGRKDKGHLGDEGRRASAERLPGRWAGAGCGLRRPPQRGPPRGTKQRRRARSLQRGPAPRRAPGARAREHARQRRRLEMAVGAEEGAGAGSGALWLGSAPAPPGIREPVCFPNPSPSVLPTLQAVCRAGKKMWPVRWNKGHDSPGTSPSRCGHCGVLGTFPKMAAGAWGRGGRRRLKGAGRGGARLARLLLRRPRR